MVIYLLDIFPAIFEQLIFDQFIWPFLEVCKFRSTL